MRTMVVFNSRSGSSAAAAAVADELARHSGVTLCYPETWEETRACVRRAVHEGYGVLCAAGGDGTVHTLVNALAPHFDALCLAVLPLGTGNDFCRSLALPLAPLAALAELETGVERRLDLIEARTPTRTRIMVNTAAGGFGGRISEALQREVKAAWGPLAYVLGAAGAFADLQRYKARIALDQHAPSDLEVLNVVVANGRFAAGGWPVASHAGLEDGLLDVVIVRDADLFHLTEVAARLVAGDYDESEAVLYRRARRVHIESRPPMWFSIDGEPTPGEPTTFTVLPAALRVLVGPGYRP